MKFRIPFALYGVLIGIISLLGVTAELFSENDEGFHECAGTYLKNKGKVEYDEPPVKTLTESECLLRIQQYKRFLKDGLRISEISANKLLSENESRCITAEFDQDMADIFIQVEFVRTNSLLSRSEKDAAMTTILEEQNNLFNALITVVTNCGIVGDRFKKLMGGSPNSDDQ